MPETSSASIAAKCEVCGEPPSPYPNWLLAKGHGYHVGCLATENERLRAEIEVLTEDFTHDEVIEHEVRMGRMRVEA